MIVLGDITQFYTAIASLRDTRLDSHHCLHLLLSRHRVVAHHLEEVLHKRLVCLTDANGLFIIVQVVVTCTESESTLPY